MRRAFLLNVSWPGLVGLIMIGALAGGCTVEEVRVQDDTLGRTWTRRTIGGGGGQTGIAIDPTNTLVVYVTTDNGGIVKSVDGGATWFSINNNIGNRRLADVQLDPLDPNMLYVAAEVNDHSVDWNDDPVNGELYRSRDGGAHWEIVFAEGLGGGDGRAFGIQQWPSTRSLLLPYDPADPRRYDHDGDGLTDVIYVGGWDEDEVSDDWRSGVWKSEDEGNTFAQLALNDKDIWTLRLDPDDPETLYAGTYMDGLWVSRDGGHSWESWRDRMPLPTVSDVVVIPGGQTLYAATNTFYSQYSGDEYRDQRGIFRSLDGGAHFEAINRGLEATSLNFEALVLDPTDLTGKTLHTGPWGRGDRGLYMTHDGGDTWRRVQYETSSQPYWFERFEGLWAMMAAADGTLFATSWRGIYRFDRDQQTWVLASEGLGNIGVEVVRFAPGDDATVYLGMSDSTPWKSLDRGATWTNIGQGFTTVDSARPASALDLAISPIDPQIVYAVGRSSGTGLPAVNKSEDGGANWRPIVVGLPPLDPQAPGWEARAVVVSAHDPAIAYLAIELMEGSGRIYRTLDGGETWDEVFAMADRPTDLAISATLPGTVVCVTASGMAYISRDAGAQWNASQISQGALLAVDIFSHDPNYILVGANVTGAFLSADGGESWRKIFDAQDLEPFTRDLSLSEFALERYVPTIRAVRFDPNEPRTLYLGHNPGPWMGVGVLKSMDAGETWALLADEHFQMRSVLDFDLDPITDNMVVGTWEAYYYRPAQP